MPHHLPLYSLTVFPDSHSLAERLGWGPPGRLQAQAWPGGYLVASITAAWGKTLPFKRRGSTRTAGCSPLETLKLTAVISDS